MAIALQIDFASRGSTSAASKSRQPADRFKRIHDLNLANRQARESSKRICQWEDWYAAGKFFVSPITEELPPVDLAQGFRWPSAKRVAQRFRLARKIRAGLRVQAPVAGYFLRVRFERYSSCFGVFAFPTFVPASSAKLEISMEKIRRAWPFEEKRRDRSEMPETRGARCDTASKRIIKRTATSIASPRLASPRCVPLLFL